MFSIINLEQSLVEDIKTLNSFSLITEKSLQSCMLYLFGLKGISNLEKFTCHKLMLSERLSTLQ